jgi:hypothetical protein
MGRRCQNCHDGRKASLEVISQLGSSVFLSQKISQQYFQPARSAKANRLSVFLPLSYQQIKFDCLPNLLFLTPPLFFSSIAFNYRIA